MIHHEVCTWRDRMWGRSVQQTVWQTVAKLFHYRYVSCELFAVLTERTHGHLAIGKRKKTQRTKGREEKVTKRLSLVRMQPLVWKKKRFLCNHISHVPVTLSTPWMRAQHRVQVWSQSGHLPVRRSDFRARTKVPVSRDLWPWPWPWAHAVCRLTWGRMHNTVVS